MEFSDKNAVFYNYYQNQLLDLQFFIQLYHYNFGSSFININLLELPLISILKMTNANITSLYQKALTAHNESKLNDAKTLYLQILDLDPRHLDTISNLGNLYNTIHEFNLTINLIEPIAHQNQSAINLQLNLANAYFSTGKFLAAKSIFQSVVKDNINHAMGWYSLGLCEQFLSDDDNAIQSYLTCLKVDPLYYDALVNISGLLSKQGENTLALNYLNRAVMADSTKAFAWNNLGSIYQSLSQHKEALNAFKKAFNISNSAHIASNILLAMQYIPEFADQQLFEAAKSFGSRFSDKRCLTHLVQKQHYHFGFVSADFYAHPVAYLLFPLIKELNQLGHECTLYSNNDFCDASTEQLKSFSNWKSITTLSDLSVSEVIKLDKVDILIDLSGHTTSNRLAVFALCPAPLQISWLGYFATTGMKQFNAVLMDSWHCPEGSETFYTEKLINIKQSRLCYTGPNLIDDIAVSAPPSMKNGYITFGSFNNTCKLNSQVIELWANLLKTKPESRLILKWRTLADSGFRNEIFSQFESLNVSRNRIELRSWSPYQEMLNQYADIDIALDTFPFSGGMTSLEALWMGIPVITMVKTRAVSRQTFAFLSLIDKQEWAADDNDQYINIAITLAADFTQLRKIRSNLRNEMLDSPLCDSALFTSNFLLAVDNLILQKDSV